MFTIRKRWTDEEVQFLKFAYPNKDFTDEEILKGFNDRTWNSIKIMAYTLGIKRYKEKFPIGYKRCSMCNTILPYSDFSKDKRRPHGIAAHCKVCNRTRYKPTKTATITETAIITETATLKKCINCKEIKKISEFHKDKGCKDGYKNKCKDCIREYDRRRIVLGGYEK